MNKIRQQGLAVWNYESANGHLPPGTVQGPFPQLGVRGRPDYLLGPAGELPRPKNKPRSRGCADRRVVPGLGRPVREGQVGASVSSDSPTGGPTMIEGGHLWAIGFDDMDRA